MLPQFKENNAADWHAANFARYKKERKRNTHNAVNV